jgi:hypothetical protein
VTQLPKKVEKPEDQKLESWVIIFL